MVSSTNIQTMPLLPARSLCPKKRSKGRQWKTRSKVPSNISKDFPWEIILSFLNRHARSLILLQMVDKNLHSIITTNHQLWLGIFKSRLNHLSTCIQEIKDPLYPTLRLWKSHLNGIPVYNGVLKGDPGDYLLADGFDAAFTSYVRRAFALMHGTRCGMCGCRYRHDAYWSLRMRVCRLCMEANTISSDELCFKYGVDYSDLILKAANKVFYFMVNNTGRDERVGVHFVRNNLELYQSEFARNRSVVYLFWVPHLTNLIDLPALCQQQKKRKEAASILSAVLQRNFILQQRHLYANKKHNSIDSLVLVIRRNERKRHHVPYAACTVPGGPSWCFPDRPRCGHNKFTARNGKPLPVFYRLIESSTDCVV